jgi:phage-related protein
MSVALPLTTKISQESTPSTLYRTISVQYGDGYQQSAPDGINDTIDTWQIIYDNLDATDYTTLKSFLDTVKCTTWFTWTPFLESTSKKWKIYDGGSGSSGSNSSSPQIQRQVNSGGTQTVSFTIVQGFWLV